MSVLGKLARPVMRPLRQLRHDHLYARSRNSVLRRFACGTVGAEISVWRGAFSAQILRTVRPKRLHLIDPWKYQTSSEFSRAFFGGAMGKSQQYMDAIHQSVMEKFHEQIKNGTVDVKRMPSDQAAGEFPDHYLDWIYLDGDHRCEGVLKDLELYHPKLKSGGVVAGDDYADAGQWWEDGVIRGVAEAIKHGLYKDLVVNYNQFILVKQ